jgi:hypothetical protein
VANTRVPRSRSLLALFFLFFVMMGCSSLSSLTPESLQSARQRWEASGITYYRMVVESKSDRLALTKYEVTVRDLEVIKFLENGQLMTAESGHAYSVEGLFHVLAQELDLAKKPELLGAPPGFSIYPMASFDSKTGRLLRYQRSVGGAKSSIEIDVKDFEALGK